MDYEVLKVTIAEKIIYTWVMCFFLLYLQHSYPYEPPKKANYYSRTQWIWYSILKPFFILTLKVWIPKGHVSSYTAKYLVFWFLTTKDQKDNLLLAGEVLNLCNCCFKKIIEDVLAGILLYPGKRWFLSFSLLC